MGGRRGTAYKNCTADIGVMRDTAETKCNSGKPVLTRKGYVADARAHVGAVECDLAALEGAREHDLTRDGAERPPAPIMPRVRRVLAVCTLCVRHRRMCM